MAGGGKYNVWDSTNEMNLPHRIAFDFGAQYDDFNGWRKMCAESCQIPSKVFEKFQEQNGQWKKCFNGLEMHLLIDAMSYQDSQTRKGSHK